MNYGNTIWGVILIVAGSLLLISNYTGYNGWLLIATYWPIILIIIGLFILLKSRLNNKI